MGFYSRVIFPRICEWAMSDPRLAALRGEALATVNGEILEIGFGSGLNLPHYPPSVRRITTVDPNPGMGTLAQSRISARGIEIDHRLQSGEELPFPAESFDCAVSTWTLCSIPEPARALSEIHRVLKPGGRFIFLEHGLSDQPKVQKWQHRLTPLQKLIADGCRLDLDIEAIVRSQPFGDANVVRFELDKMPRTHGTMYRGTAVK
jgi:SAM-dependent methyltransferase